MVFNPINPVSIPSSTFYPVGASTFDGSTTNLEIVSLGGLSSGSSGSISLWVKFDAGDGTSQGLFDIEATGNKFISLVRFSTNTIRMTLGSGISSFTFESVGTYTTSSGWVNVEVSWNTAFSAGNKLSNLIINGISDKTVVSDASSSFSFGTTNGVISVGAFETTGLVKSNFLNGSLSQVWYNPTRIDFSSLSNIRHFISSTKRPMFLGSNGSLPTGSQPNIYLNGSGTGFNTNSGSSGNFTTTGTLTTPSTTPSNP